MDSEHSNETQLVIGLNPGKMRSTLGAVATYSTLVIPLFSIVGDMMLWTLLWLVVPLSIVLTCGQQYRLDSEADELSKRYLFFLKQSPWEVLNKASAITKIERHKDRGEDGSEPLNSRIEFYFNDGTDYTWSMFYGPSEDYASQINMFLQSFEKAKDLVVYDAPLSGSSDEGEAMPSATPPSTVWEQPKPTSMQTPATPSSASSNVWDIAPATPDGAKSDTTSVWDQ